MDPVAVGKAMGFGHTSGIVVDGRAVRGDVMQPVATVAEVNFAVLARDESFGIRQRPVEIRVTADIDSTAINLDEDRPAVRQRVNVFDSQN